MTKEKSTRTQNKNGSRRDKSSNGGFNGRTRLPVESKSDWNNNQSPSQVILLNNPWIFHTKLFNKMTEKNPLSSIS